METCDWCDDRTRDVRAYERKGSDVTERGWYCARCYDRPEEDSDTTMRELGWIPMESASAPRGAGEES